MAAPPADQSTVQAQSPSGTPSQESFLANDRLEIPAIHDTLKVAEPNEIPIAIHGSGLKTIVSDQRDDAIENYRRDGLQTLEILHHADGSTYFNIIPLYLGKLTIRLMATFADGKMALQNVTVDVGPSKVSPAALGLGPRPSPSGVFIDRKAESAGYQSPSYLRPVAYYYGLRSPVSVPPQLATFDLTTGGSPPVVQIDPATGRVTALRTGDAMLETRYAGAVMHTCIQVRDASYFSDGSNRNDCKELRHLDELAVSAPLSQTWAADPGGNLTFYDAYSYFFADRLAVAAPDRPVGLGQPVQIPVRLSGDKVRYIVFRQWIYNNGADIAIPALAWDANGASLSGNESVPIGQKRVDPLKDGGETGKFLEIVPLALGNIEVGIGVYFEDGGFSERFFRMKVIPSSHGLLFSRGIEACALRPPEDQSEASESPRATQLTAEVVYAAIRTGASYHPGPENVMRISSLEGVKFSIQQAPGPPVIQVDEKGWVQALHSGDAVVVADFAGVKWQYPIHVLAHNNQALPVIESNPGCERNGDLSPTVRTFAKPIGMAWRQFWMLPEPLGPCNPGVSETTANRVPLPGCWSAA